MKTLFLLRHAKSSWDDPVAEDIERPLAPRGEKDAPRVGAFLAATKNLPDLIVSSPAERAKATAKRVARAAGYDGDLRLEPAIYLADAATLLDVVRRLPDDHARVMLVGHNPGFEELAAALCGGSVRLPTAAVACIELDIARWVEARAGAGTLVWLVTPKVLP
jgi:phosphohistidine phosphatase